MLATNRLQQDQQHQQQQQRQSTSSTARGKRGIAMQQMEELRLPSIRVLAQERTERALCARAWRSLSSARASAALIADDAHGADVDAVICWRSRILSAMRARLNERARRRGVAVRFSVSMRDESTCDSSTTIRVPLPFAVNVPATLSAWREYVRDVAMPTGELAVLCAPMRCCACQEQHACYCVMISNRLTRARARRTGVSYVQVHARALCVGARAACAAERLHAASARAGRQGAVCHFVRTALNDRAARRQLLAEQPRSVARRRPFLLDSECRICCTACIECSEPYCCMHCGRNFHAQCMVRCARASERRDWRHAASVFAVAHV
jgi:hypothetical protein